MIIYFWENDHIKLFSDYHGEMKSGRGRGENTDLRRIFFNIQ